MSIIKGAKNMDAAKKFYDFALTAQPQELGAAEQAAAAAVEQERANCPTQRRSSRRSS